LSQDVDVADLAGTGGSDHAFAELGQELALGAVQLVLVGQAAEQATAQAADALGIEHEPLFLGHLDADGGEVLEEGGAAELQAAGGDATKHLRRVAHADLPEFDAPLGGRGDATVQLAEVDALLAGEEDYDLAALLRLRADDLDGEVERGRHVSCDAKYFLFATLASGFRADLGGVEATDHARQSTAEELATVGLDHHARAGAARIAFDGDDFAAIVERVASVVEPCALGAVTTNDDGVVEGSVARAFCDGGLPGFDVDGGVGVEGRFGSGLYEENRGTWLAGAGDRRGRRRGFGGEVWRGGLAPAYGLRLLGLRLLWASGTRLSGRGRFLTRGATVATVLVPAVGGLGGRRACRIEARRWGNRGGTLG